MSTAAAIVTLIGVAWFSLAGGIGTLQAWSGVSGRTSIHFDDRLGNTGLLVWCVCAAYTAIGAL